MPLSPPAPRDSSAALPVCRCKLAVLDLPRQNVPQRVESTEAGASSARSLGECRGAAMLRLSFVTIASLLTASCGPSGSDQANKQGPDVDLRRPTLKIEPAEFAGGSTVTAQASLPQVTGALGENIACGDVSDPGAVKKSDPHYDVAFITLNEAGEEVNKFLAPNTHIPLIDPCRAILGSTLRFHR